MWRADRRRFLLLATAAPLAACGFTPALAPGAPAAGLTGQIRADDPADADAFALVERLEERLGRPAPGARWRLSYNIATEEDRLGRARGLGDSRAQIAGSLRYQLRAAGGEAVLASGTVSQFAGYSLTSTPLANRAAEEDARRRLMRMLADALATELMATAGGWATAA